MGKVRKIRITLDADLFADEGPLIDIDLGYDNLELDLHVDEKTVKEYELDLPAGTHQLTFIYKNNNVYDGSIRPYTPSEGEDRNLIIEQIEIANNGVDYEVYDISEGAPEGAIATWKETYWLHRIKEVVVWTWPVRMWENGSASFPVEFT